MTTNNYLLGNNYQPYKKDREEERELKIITVNLPRILLKIFDKLKESGYYSSRSELIRQLVIEGIPSLLKKFEELGILTAKLNYTHSKTKINFHGKDYKIVRRLE